MLHLPDVQRWRTLKSITYPFDYSINRTCYFRLCASTNRIKSIWSKEYWKPKIPKIVSDQWEYWQRTSRFLLLKILFTDVFDDRLWNRLFSILFSFQIVSCSSSNQAFFSFGSRHYYLSSFPVDKTSALKQESNLNALGKRLHVFSETCVWK